MLGKSGFDPRKAPSLKGEFEKIKTTDNASILQLAVVTKACFGASICKNSSNFFLKRIWPIHLLSIALSRNDGNLLFFEKVILPDKLSIIDQIVTDFTKMPVLKKVKWNLLSGKKYRHKFEVMSLVKE